nr:reverse transcriptase domain-containing protein [Tanacetum cinerariifolium]
MEKFKTPPDSPPVIIIDLDDQPMWSSTRNVTPTPSFAIIQRPISNNFHIKADFLVISNIFQYGENQEEAVMLRTFPFSLSEEANTWLNALNEATITSWTEMREAFISRYFSLAKFKRLLNKIHGFHQLEDESLVDSWLRLKEMLLICYGRTCNIFQYGENQEESVMLRTFPFSLSEEANTWLNALNEVTITSWTEMREAFISRYFSLVKFKRLLNKIHGFHQLEDESLVDSWLRLKEMILTCYGHGLTKGAIIQIFYHGLDDPTQGILDAGGIFLYNTPNKAFKILEDKGGVKAIEEDEIKPIPIVPNPNPITRCIPNNTGDKELKSSGSVGNKVLTKKEVKKDGKGVPKEPNKEWKLNDKVVPHNEDQVMMEEDAW